MRTTLSSPWCISTCGVDFDFLSCPPMHRTPQWEKQRKPREHARAQLFPRNDGERDLFVERRREIASETVDGAGQRDGERKLKGSAARIGQAGRGGKDGGRGGSVDCNGSGGKSSSSGLSELLTTVRGRPMDCLPDHRQSPSVCSS